MKKKIWKYFSIFIVPNLNFLFGNKEREIPSFFVVCHRSNLVIINEKKRKRKNEKINTSRSKESWIELEVSLFFGGSCKFCTALSRFILREGNIDMKIKKRIIMNILENNPEKTRIIVKKSFVRKEDEKRD